MPQTGAQGFSLKGEGPWSGLTTISRSGVGQMLMLRNLYVSRDGREIRTFPGFKCVADPVSDGRTAGYLQDVVESRRHVSKVLGNYRQRYTRSTATEAAYCYADVANIHGFERVRDRWIIFGETKFRRMPVLALGGVEVTVTDYNWTSGTTIDLTFSAAWDSVTYTENNPVVGMYFHVDGLTGTDVENQVNGKTHEVTALIGTTGVTLTISGGTGAGSASGQSGGIWRVTTPMSLASNRNWDDEISSDKESLTTWSILDKLYTSAPVGELSMVPTANTFTAYVANRVRDWGDRQAEMFEGRSIPGEHSFSRREQLEIPYRLVPSVSPDRLILAAPGYGCVFQVPVRLGVDFSGSDTSKGIDWEANDQYDRPRCVGIPKALMLEDTSSAAWGDSIHHSQPVLTAEKFGGSNQAGRQGTYKFRVAYRDTATGEVGIASEEISITTDGTTPDQGIRLFILVPGYLMPECMANAIEIHRTAKDGSTFYFDRTIDFQKHDWGAFAAGTADSGKFGLLPSNAAEGGTDTYHQFVIYEAQYMEDADLADQPTTLPTIEQMPMGCKAVRTARGFTVYGGALGNAGPNLEMFRAGGDAFMNSSAAQNVDPDKFLLFDYWDESTGTPDQPHGAGLQWGCAFRGIPPAYAGQKIWSRYAWPWPNETLQLNIMHNTVIDGGAGAASPNFPSLVRYTKWAVQNWSVVIPPLIFGNSWDQSDEMYLILPRNQIQVSEQDNPGVTPATNTLVIGSDRDDDIEGIGNAGGQFIAATKSKSYLLGFSRSPLNVNPEISSDRFGCIAANSMTEFDGGCVAISDRGPVAFAGAQFMFIGEALEHYFQGESARYKRDSQGMMRHSWACHDAERGLVYFGVFRDRLATDNPSLRVTIEYRGTQYNWDTDVDTGLIDTPDEAKSRFPCDELLVWSYKTNSWSTYECDHGQEIKWMTRGEDGNGQARVFAMLADNRIYALDDAYGQYNKDALLAVTASASTGTTVTTTGGYASDRTSIGSPTGINNHIAIGMRVAITSSDSVLIGTRTIVAFDLGANTITFDTPITVEAGYGLRLGVREAELRTAYFNPKQGNERSRIPGLNISYGFWSRWVYAQNNVIDVPVPQPMWVKAEVQSSDRVSNQDTSDAVQQVNDFSQGYTFMGYTPNEDVQLERGFKGATSEGFHHQVRLTIVSSAQIRLTDLDVEVQ